MANLKRRLMKMEKKRGKGMERFRFLILYDGDPDPPEIRDPDVFTMIMDLRQDRHKRGE
jgi:hypothetical protein